MQLPNSLALAISKRRYLHRPLRPLLPDVAEFEVISSLRLYIDPADRTGPSFYLSYGGPAAFYHYEEAEKGEILRHFVPDGVFLDIGANIGLFSIFLARYFPAAQFYAFEPHPLLQRCLTMSRDRNQFFNIHCEPLALASRAGRMPLFIHKQNSGGHSLRAGQISEIEREPPVSVEVTTLDQFARDRKLKQMNMLKIDVQGAEWDVLQGGRECLARFRPAILIEMENDALVKPDAETEDGMRLLRELNYRVGRIGEAGVARVDQLGKLAEAGLQAGRLQSNYMLLPAASA